MKLAALAVVLLVSLAPDEDLKLKARWR